MPRKSQGWITFQTSDSERLLLEQYCQLAQRSKTEVLRELLRSLISASLNPEVLQERQSMKVSARNQIKGSIKHLVFGAVNAEVVLEVAPGFELTAIITKTSAENLGLVEGKQAYAVIKSSDIMIAID